MKKGDLVMEKTNKIRWKELLVLGGAYVSYAVGASFGTGIATLQFHGALGAMGIVSQVISCILTVSLIYVVTKGCGEYGMHDMQSMFEHYCGKYIGTAFRWFLVAMLFLYTGTMFSGAAATFNTSFGIPVSVGTVIMLIAVACTVLLGAKKLIDIIGNIAPVILVVVLIVCVYALFNHTDTLMAGSEILIEGTKEIRIGTNPLLVAFLEFGNIIVMTSGYLAMVSGRKDVTRKELLTANMSAHVVLVGFQLMLIVAFILNASRIAGSAVPVVVLSSGLGNVFGKIFALILELAIYTTAAGMAWQVVANLVPESSKWYKPLCIVITLCAYGFTYLGPFGILMRFVGLVSAYAGVAFIVCLVFTKIFREKDMKKTEEQ